MRAGGGIGEDQRHVLGPDIAAIDAVRAARAPLDPANNFERVIVVAAICVQHYFGKIARRALRSPGEDHVFHPATAHRFGRIFTHDPADCLKQVRFAAAVGPDHPGQPAFNPQVSWFDKALKSTEL